MSKPESHELEALEEAGILLRFAAESKQIPENIISAIAISWQAKADDKWSPEISSKFWPAYNSLCTAIQPASLDTISSNSRARPPRLWQFWRPVTSLSKATAEAYLALLAVALVSTIVLQFAVSNAANQIDNVDKLKTTMDQMMTGMADDMAKIRGGIGSRRFPDAKLTPDQSRAIVKIQNAFRTIWITEDQIATKVNVISVLTGQGHDSLKWTKAGFDPIQSVVEYDKETQTYWSNVRDFQTLKNERR